MTSQYNGDAMMHKIMSKKNPYTVNCWIKSMQRSEIFKFIGPKIKIEKSLLKQLVLRGFCGKNND